MTKNALIRFSLTLLVAVSAASNSPGQQPDQQLPSYYDYPYGSRTTKTRTLSVEQAVNLALENAASLRQAQLEGQSGGEDVKLSRAAMLPQFNMPLTYWGTTPSTVRQPGEPVTFSFVASSEINERIGWLSTT